MSSRVQSTKIAFSKNKQVDIATATPIGNMFSFTKLNSSLGAANLGIESDAPEYGKGNEFAQAIYATAWDVSIPIEKYGTSEFLAWLFSYGLGNSVMSGTGAIASPGTVTPTPSGTGGTIAAGTYYGKVTALNALGETLGSPEFTVTVSGATSSVALAWVAVTGATSYRVYWGTVAGAESSYFAAGTNSFTVALTAGTAGTVPVANTTGTGSTYTILPIVPGAGLELPYFTYVEQIAGTDLDRMAVGCAIEDLTLTINSGPGRQNCRVTATAVGSGRITSPSAVTVPAPISETILPAGIATVNIMGTDYVAAKNLVSVTMGWKNNILLSEGFFPGSGFQTAGVSTSGQVRGRLEIGTRVPTFQFVVRVGAGSTEAAQLAALTTNTATVTLPVGVNHSFSAVWQKMSFRQVSRSDTNGIATIVVQGEPMYDATNGILTVVVKTDVANICQ